MGCSFRHCRVSLTLSLLCQARGCFCVCACMPLFACLHRSQGNAKIAQSRKLPHHPTLIDSLLVSFNSGRKQELRGQSSSVSHWQRASAEKRGLTEWAWEWEWGCVGMDQAFHAVLKRGLPGPSMQSPGLENPKRLSCHPSVLMWVISGPQSGFSPLIYSSDCQAWVIPAERPHSATGALTHWAFWTGRQILS